MTSATYCLQVSLVFLMQDSQKQLIIVANDSRRYSPLNHPRVLPDILVQWLQRLSKLILGMDGTTSKVSFLLKAPPILYWFPGAVTTKYHKLGVFEKTEIYCLTVLQAGYPKLRCQQGYVLSEICRDEFPLASSSFWWCLSVLGSSLQSPSL